MESPKKIIYMVYHKTANFPSAVFENWVSAQKYIEQVPIRNAQMRLQIHEVELKTA